MVTPVDAFGFGNSGGPCVYLHNTTTIIAGWAQNIRDGPIRVLRISSLVCGDAGVGLKPIIYNTWTLRTTETKIIIRHKADTKQNNKAL